MDAFYASVEQRDNPELRGKPVAVGGSSKRGVVTTASYEARKFGVRSAMSSVVAARKCPGLIFVKTRFDVYRQVSREIRAIFRRYTPLVEPLSLDEAYLDVTDPLRGPRSATLIAEEIRVAIFSETGLTASAGVSFNKFLAKVGSDVNKPDGITVITPEMAPDFLSDLLIEKFYGVGPVTAARMHKMGIFKGKDLLRLSEIEMRERFGKAGGYYYRTVRCQDNRQVHPNRTRKSVGAERTFEEDVSDRVELQRRLRPIAEAVAARMGKAKVIGKTVTLKIKYHDFVVRSRQTTSDRYVRSADELFDIVGVLLDRLVSENERAIRLLGVSVSRLHSLKDDPVEEQLRLSFSESVPVA